MAVRIMKVSDLFLRTDEAAVGTMLRQLTGKIFISPGKVYSLIKRYCRKYSSSLRGCQTAISEEGAFIDGTELRRHRIEKILGGIAIISPEIDMDEAAALLLLSLRLPAGISPQSRRAGNIYMSHQNELSRLITPFLST